MGKHGKLSKMQQAANLEIKESEISKVEELNRREKKALDDRADLIRRRQALDSVDDGEPDDGDAAPVISPFDSMDPGFVEALESLNSEGQLVIYKESKTGMAKVGHYPVMDAETMERQLDSIAHEHGGGTFVVRLLGPNGKIAKQKSFTFDAKAYAKEAPAGSDGGATAMMIQMMIESRKETADLLKTFIMSQRPTNGAGLGVEQLVALAPLFKQAGGSPDNTKNMMELFTTALSWGRDLAEGKAPNGGEDNILKDLVAPFLSVLANIKGIQAPALASPRLAMPGPSIKAGSSMPAPKPAPADLTPPEAERGVIDSPHAPQEAAVDPSVQAVKSSFVYKLYVPTLLKAAKDGADPEQVADDILNTVPDTHHGVVKKLAESPDVVNYLAAFEPVAANYAEWIKKVAAFIVDMLTDDAPAEEAPDGLTTVPPVPLVENGTAEKVAG